MLDQDKSKQELIEELAEMRRRVATLEAAERRYRTIIDTVPLAIGEINRDGIIVFANAATEKVFGYKPEELVGKRVGDGIETDAAREAFRAWFRQTMTEQPPPNPVFVRQVNKNDERIDIRGDWNYLRNENEEVIGQITVIADITEQKRAEEQRQQFISLAENSHEFIGMCDTQFKPFFVNEAGMRMVGLDDLEQALQTSVREFFFAEDHAFIMDEFFPQVLRNGHGEVEIRFRHFKTGEPLWMIYAVFALTDATGKPSGLATVSRNITERKRAEEALQKAHDELEQRIKERTAELAKANENLEIFHRFAEDAEEGFRMSDFDGRILYANATLCRLFGEEKPEDVIGKHVSAYYPAEYMELREEKLIPALLRDGHCHIEQTVLPRHGKPILTLQTTFLIRDDGGNPFRIGSVISDITDRKRAEEALRQSHDELQAIYNGMIEGLLITDIETKRFLRVNSAMCRMLGYSEEELLAASIEDIHPPEEVPNDLQRFQAAAEGRVSINEDRPVLRKDGSIFYADITGHRVFYHDRPCLLALFRDITERKQAEEALRASEERFRVTFEEAPVGMVIGEGDGVIVKANRAVCRMTGYTPEEMIGQHVRDLTHPDDRELSSPLVKRLMAGEIPSFTLEKRYLRKDGQPFWAQATTAVVHHQYGKTAFALGIVEDITKRKQAEEALRQSERRFRNYFEQGLIGMAVTSVDKRWLEVNDRLCEIVGYSREELHQKNWAELTHPDDLEENCRLFNRLLAGETEKFIFNKRYLKQDGSIVYTTIYTRAFRRDDGTIDHIVLLVEDITDRKRAEEALRQSHDELRAIYDGMFDGLLVADIETRRFVRGNAAMARMLGYSEAELRSLSVEDIHPEADLPFVIEQFQGLAEGRLHISEDIPVLRKDGSVFYALITTSKVTHDDRRCVVGFFRDITERKRAQEALAKEHRNLKHLLHASDHERQLIAYEIHDGLAQELAGAIMQFEAFDHLKVTKPKQAADAYHAAMTMLRQGHSEARRLIAGVRPPILDEEGIVAAVGHLVHEQIRLKGPKIEYRSRVDFDRLDPTLENAVYRIAQEALTNACQHSKSKKVSVGLLQAGDRLRIEIRDWGVGFDPKAVPKNHFGLEGIRQRARLLGGKCSIQSKVGKGSRIMVELPVVPRDEEE